MKGHVIRRIADSSDLQGVCARVEAIERLCFDDSHYNRYLAVGCALWGALYCVFTENSEIPAGHALYFYCRQGMPESAGREAYLASIAIAPEFQGMGLGRSLLAESLNLLATEGITGVEMTVAPENSGAMKLYMTSGFFVKELKINFYGPGEDRLVLRKNMVVS